MRTRKTRRMTKFSRFSYKEVEQRVNNIIMATKMRDYNMKQAAHTKFMVGNTKLKPAPDSVQRELLNKEQYAAGFVILEGYSQRLGYGKQILLLPSGKTRKMAETWD